MISRRVLLTLVVSGLIVPAPVHNEIEPSKPVTIGIAAPLTGNAASYGAQIKAATEIWCEQVNANGGMLGRQVKLVTADDRGEPKEAVTVANLISTYRPFAVLGHGLSGTTQPAKAVYGENKILLLANADSLTDPASPYVLRILPRNRDYAKPVAKHVKYQAGLVSGSIYLIDDNTNYGKGLTDETYRLLPDDLKERVVRRSVTNGEGDYTAEITHMRAAKSAIVVLAMPESTAGLILRQAARQNYFPAFIGHSRLTFQDFGRTVTDNNAQVTVIGVPGSDNSTTHDRQSQLIAAFKKHNQELGATELGVYAGLDLLHQAVIRANSFDPLALSEALHAGSYQSITGQYRFDRLGNLIEPPLVAYNWRTENGQAVLRQAAALPQP